VETLNVLLSRSFTIGGHKFNFISSPRVLKLTKF
jgi:hypothetical protein